VNDRNDNNFDQLLREHFSRELDGQLGRKIAPTKRARPTRLLIGAIVALAASIAGIVLLRPVRGPVKTQTVATFVRVARRLSDGMADDRLGNRLRQRPPRCAACAVVKSRASNGWTPRRTATIELTIPHD